MPRCTLCYTYVSCSKCNSWLCFNKNRNYVNSYRGARKMLQLFKTKSTLFKVNNRNTTTRYKICSKLTIKTAEWHQWRRSGVFTVEFEQCHLENIFAYFRSTHPNLFWKIAVLETEFFHRYFSMIFPGFPKHLFCVTDASSASCIYIVIFCHYWSTLRWHRHIFPSL